MLTERTIVAAKPAEREVRLFDGRGLYLAIRPTGGKSWKWKYRWQGREKKLTLGPYPLLSLKDARRARDAARTELLAGRDPGATLQIAKRRAKDGETFKEVALSWHKAKAPTLSPRYAAQVLARLEANVFPRLGKMAIGQITPVEVLETIRVIERRGAKTMAHEVRGHISEVFVWAIASGLAETDPAAIIRKALAPASKSNFPAILAIDELQELVKAIDGVRHALKATRLASRLLALTAVRPGVVRLAEREEFEELDGPMPLWRIPAAKMKLSRELKADSRRDFLVPLSSQAVATAQAAMRTSRHKSWLFPGLIGRAPISDSTLSQLYLDAGYRGRHVPHGWRASFSTIMNEWAAQQGREDDTDIIDRMLAHVKGDVEAAYNRAAYLPRRRQIAQAWADMLMQGLPPPESLIA